MHMLLFIVFRITNKKLWEELIAYFPLIRNGLHKERRTQQFIYCCMYTCILCRGTVFTEPLSSNDRGMNVQLHELKREI
jgi:hypothetical protein